MGKHTVTGQPTGALHFMCPYYKYDAIECMSNDYLFRRYANHTCINRVNVLLESVITDV